ncbi:MAG: hypothetical protein ACR2P2_06830 [Nakamurella sp.]
MQEQQPPASTSGGMLPPVASEVTVSRHPVRRTASLSMSISGTLPQRRSTSALMRRRFRGSGWAGTGVSLIVADRRSVICTRPSCGSAASSVLICSRSPSTNTAGSKGLRSSR